MTANSHVTDSITNYLQYVITIYDRYYNSRHVSIHVSNKPRTISNSLVLKHLKQEFIRPCLEAGRATLVLGFSYQEGYPGTCIFLLSSTTRLQSSKGHPSARVTLAAL